jgi:hypothetical protein
MNQKFETIIFTNEKGLESFIYKTEYNKNTLYEKIKIINSKKYIVCMCIVNNTEYIVYKRSKSNYDKYIKDCNCVKCKCSFYNPVKYILCEHCTKCVKMGYKENIGNKNNHLKYAEMLILFFLIITIMYFLFY